MCGEASANAAVCSVCVQTLPWLAGPLCPVCALPSAVAGLCCGRCQQRAPNFDATHAVFVYAQPVREMILSLKHAQGFVLMDWFCDQLGQKLTDLQADALLPMSLHPHRLAERGFNQSVELARRLARQNKLSLHMDAVVRDVDTPKLAGLRGKQRRRLVRGVFRCTEDFSGQHLVVIDDVMTSGATLNELARSLKQRGAMRVTNLVVARTLRMPRK